ncbi:hypothetical protein FNU76_00615 [Chitinimonas arctica]|uniref:Uncharacterized protein n=1 Tax=Chitinimonas arctica TaxID=2594795 RepID=A0A516SA06_9NEIS|nr:hypothetical protein [Chitinimonas arctica]QDQ24967.1 hypothetical protein FNU76_00615 [Chitinimonas arctica]
MKQRPILAFIPAGMAALEAVFGVARCLNTVSGRFAAQLAGAAAFTGRKPRGLEGSQSYFCRSTLSYHAEKSSSSAKSA